MTAALRTAACAIAAMLALGRAVAAAPTALVAAPAGWRPDPEQAAELGRRVAGAEHFGGLPAVTAVEAHLAPRPGVALFATRATARLPDPAAAPRAARAALDELRATTRRSSLLGGAAEEHAWQERVEAGARQVTAILHWSDPASHTVGNARIVVVSDGRQIAAVTGECLVGDGGDRAAADACIAQLASLDPGIAPADRVALAPEPAAAPGAAPAAGYGSPPPLAASPAAPPPAASPAPPPPATMAPANPALAPPRLDDGTRIVLPPMVIPQDRTATDRRPAYVGAGLVVLALAFWWNRRRRDRFEREEGAAPPARRRRPAGDRDDRDDADDLHAAARGDASDPPDAPDAPGTPTEKPSP